jgi:hypothetical protein
MMKLKSLLALCLAIPMTALNAHAQHITGTPGSPDATTTINGRYLPSPAQPFRGQKARELPAS